MKYLFPIVLVALLCSCDDSGLAPAPVNLKGARIAALASPVRLNPDSTFIHLEDYLDDVSLVDSVIVEGFQRRVDYSQKGIYIMGGASKPIVNMKIYSGDFEYDIPVFASAKQRMSLQYKTSNPDVKDVQIVGSVNGWNARAGQCEQREDGFWYFDIWLNPGLYEYQMVEDGEWLLDANNPSVKKNGMGGWNSTFIVGDPKAETPWIELKSAVELKTNITLAENLFVYHENKRLEVLNGKNGELVWELDEQLNELERTHLRVWYHDGIHISNDILIPLKKGVLVESTAELTRHDRQANIMYFMLVDRFKDGNMDNTLPVDDDSILPIANHFGGDFTGITQKVDDGYFDKLGVNTLWVSPITQNPEGAWGLWNKGVTSKFSGYHGYWPVSSKTIDYHFGSDSTLRTLIETLHINDMNLLVDYVANHVHEEHPIYKQHPDWATELYLPDGRMNTELWDEQRLTTWFDTFLPTLDFSRQEVIDAMTDSAMYWVENYDIDGFRHDATKHIQEEFWRTLTKKIKTARAGGDALFQIGETYGNPELISGYVGSGQMDSQFDFNLYDAAVDAFAKRGSGFQNLGRVLDESLTWYGSHHVMGNITGNQDRARFISYADSSVAFAEDAKLAGWTREINNRSEVGFDRLKSLMVFLMTTPGIPCIYYGDEIGLPGANDPDNRRMMLFEELDSSQQCMLELTQKIIQLRRGSMALNYGSTEIIESSSDRFVYTRKYMDEEVMVIFRKGGTHEIEIETKSHWKSVFGGQLRHLEDDHLEKVNGVVVSVKDFEVLVNV